MSRISGIELNSIMNVIECSMDPGFIKKEISGIIKLENDNFLVSVNARTLIDGSNIQIIQESHTGSIITEIELDRNIELDTSELTKFISDDFSEDLIETAKKEYRILKSAVSKIHPITVEEGIRIENVYFGDQVPPELRSQVPQERLYADMHIGTSIHNKITANPEDKSLSSEKRVIYIVVLAQEKEIIDRKAFSNIMELTEFLSKTNGKPSGIILE